MIRAQKHNTPMAAAICNCETRIYNNVLAACPLNMLFCRDGSVFKCSVVPAATQPTLWRTSFSDQHITYAELGWLAAPIGKTYVGTDHPTGSSGVESDRKVKWVWRWASMDFWSKFNVKYQCRVRDRNRSGACAMCKRVH